MRLLILLLTLSATSAQLLTSQWIIDSNDTSPWESYGLTRREGLCSWTIKDRSQNLELFLYQNQNYTSYLRVKIYFNFSINKAYPYYNGLAHADYQFYEENKPYPIIKNFSLMPDIFLFNSTLQIVEGNSTLYFTLEDEKASGTLLLLATCHALLKVLLILAMVKQYRRANTKLSLAFVYVMIGWELQAHIHTIKVFEATRDPDLMGLGVVIGLCGWLATLPSLFLLPPAISPCQLLEGLAYYTYECISGPFFSQATNIMLYAISPILQIRFNVIRNVKNSICPYALSLYLINIIFLYYIKGCPACPLRYPVDLLVCVKATLIGVVLSVLIWMQGRSGPLLCARQLVNGKDFSYIEQINLSEGEEMIDDVCSICLQPLITEDLVENIRQKNGIRIGNIMKTPCNHRYHGSCLRNWMQEKNSCPMDNQEIPPCFE